jgi:hypothetical protein
MFNPRPFLRWEPGIRRPGMPIGGTPGPMPEAPPPNNPMQTLPMRREGLPEAMPGGMRMLGNFKKGGKVKKTGLYKLHKGERVLRAKMSLRDLK